MDNMAFPWPRQAMEPSQECMYVSPEKSVELLGRRMSHTLLNLGQES